MSFEHTKAALAIYDAGEAQRNAAWDAIVTELQVTACVKADRDALRLVQEAFHKDTAHINLLGSCLSIDIDYMRRMADAG